MFVCVMKGPGLASVNCSLDYKSVEGQAGIVSCAEACLGEWKMMMSDSLETPASNTAR